MKRSGLPVLISLVLQALVILAFGRVAQGQPDNAIGTGTAEPTTLQPNGVCAVVIGIGHNRSALSRLTGPTDAGEVGDALRQLASESGKAVNIVSLVGPDATLRAIEKAPDACADIRKADEFRLFYYAGSAYSVRSSSSNAPRTTQWLLSTSETLTAEEPSADQGLPFTDLGRLLKPMVSRANLAIFDVLLDSSSDAQAAAKALADAVRPSGIPFIILVAHQVDYLESATSADSYVARAVSTALTTRRPDEVPYGDTDGRITLTELSRFIEDQVKHQWLHSPSADAASLQVVGLQKDYRVVTLRSSRLAMINQWRENLGQFLGKKGLEPRLMVEARSVLEGKHNIESVPEGRRADLINLVQRLSNGDITTDDYVFQRHILLGEAGAPPTSGGSGAGKGGFNIWSSIPPVIRLLILLGMGGVLVYVICRVFLLRSSEVKEEGFPVMADDFLTIGQSGAKPAGKPTGTKQETRRIRPVQPAAIRPIRPVGSPASGAGAPSLPRGASAPTPSRGVPGAASAYKLGPVPPSIGTGTSPEDEESFDNIERPPSIADLKARSSSKTEPAPPGEAVPPTPAKATPAAISPSPSPPESSEPPQQEVQLDLDVLGADKIPAPADFEGIIANTPESPDTPGLDLLDIPTPKSVPRSPVLSPSSTPAEKSAPAGQTAQRTPPERPPAPAVPAMGQTGMPISPGVLPAIIRIWDLEWVSPVARSRFRLLLGPHLEMGRPSRALEGEDAELVISLLPVGEDRKPNPALIAMLSRKAFAIDSEAEGVQVTVLNKASAHMSPDPNRPYWDWDNPMPGTKHPIAPAETLWVSPHFGKSLAPISIRALTTAGQSHSPCAAEMHFDPTFHDLVGITVILIPDEFELLWGGEEPAQVLPNVGEGPAQWIRMRYTEHGLAIAPLSEGQWSRRQGRMLDEQTLLLGGVSSVEWKSDRGEMSLKLTPHALPRIGTLAPKPGPGA